MRAARLISALLLLQARGRMTAADLARELEVSERTVYRDLADLGAAGVPVYGERGDGGGYRLVEGYRTNLTGLTSDEASALLLTGGPGAAAELGLGGLLAATRLKLLAAIPPGLRDVATRAEERFLQDPSAWTHARRIAQSHLRSIAHAVWQDQQVRITHRRPGRAPVQQVVHPLGLIHKTGAWYLVAARAGRPLVYRVDRIESAQIVDAPVERPSDFHLAAFWEDWERSYARSLPNFWVHVRVGPHARRYLDSLGSLGPRAITDSVDDGDAAGWLRQNWLFDGSTIALGAALALAPDIEVLEPAELRRDVAAVALRVASIHSARRDGPADEPG